MYFLIMRMTGLIRDGKGCRQHMSKLHDNADAICAVHARRPVCALRALVIAGTTGGVPIRRVSLFSGP